MASKAHLVGLLLKESGKDSPTVQKEIEQKVGEITVELLQQNDGRFKGLLREQTITVAVGTSAYLLNPDFHTAMKTAHEVNSAGKVVRKLTVISRAEYISRLDEGAYAGELMAYIDFLEDGPQERGYYLIFGDTPTATAIYKFPYYREPTENDADVIRKFNIVKRGVRGSLPHLFPTTALLDAEIYLRHLEGFKERAEKFRTTAGIIVPAPRVGAFNRRMNDIGQGK